MKPLAKMIGQRIRNYRNEQRLSQEKLAELAGLHASYIGQLERGEKNATIESIEKVSSALGVPLSQLFEKLDEKTTDNNIALHCYELVSQKSKAQQERLYHMLLEMEEYKNQ